MRTATWEGEIPRNRLSISTKNILGTISTLFEVDEEAANDILNSFKQLKEGSEGLQSTLAQYENKSKEYDKDLTSSSMPSSNPELIQAVEDFRKWLQSAKAQQHLRKIDNEKKEVKELMKKLESLDKGSQEFEDLVLYGLLAYSKTRKARRVSTFPVFMDIKQFLGWGPQGSLLIFSRMKNTTLQYMNPDS